MRIAFLITALFVASFWSVNAQGALQIERSKQMLQEERFLYAIKLAEKAFESGKKEGNLAIQTEARLLLAQGLFGNYTATSLPWRQKNRVRKALKAAEALLIVAPNDTLAFQLRQLEQRFNNKPSIDLKPGGVAEKRPSIEQLKQRKIDVIRAVGDTLLTLKKERAAYEAEVASLSEAQARQELLLAHQQQTIDSISMARLSDSITVMRQEQLLQAQEAELALQRTQRDRIRIVGGAIILIALILTWLYINSRRKNRIINQERKRSDDLLLNILPATVAQELKTEGQATAKLHNEVTVLFSDFKDFSVTSKSLSPADLVDTLDRCFKAFDEIAARHGVEKIKTIGDAYMGAAGVPVSAEDDAQRAVLAALEMQDWLQQQQDLPFSGARIGLHTGPVVAGVVGARKFAYDIWGDTVNLAARLESKGEVGKVNISQATFDHVKGAFKCTPRGKIPAKGIGEVEMYFVD